MIEPDILADAMTRLLKAGIAPDVVIRTISEVRQAWRGATVYIHSIDRHARDKAITEALTAGLPITKTAKAARCHVSTVRKVKSEWLL